MMSMFSRLRRSVALFICPELTAPVAEQVPQAPVREDRTSCDEPKFHFSRSWKDECAEAYQRGVMQAQERLDLESRIFFAPSPWREVIEWLNESRVKGWKLPKDREAYIGALVLLASDMSGPLGRGRK